MRFVPDNGIAIRDLQRRAALNGKEAKVWLTRIGKWWGYIAVDRSASDNPLDWIVRPTAGGNKALRVWRPLTGIFEERWEKRFGKDMVAELRQSLQLLVRQPSPNLPDYLPILGYETLSKGPESSPPAPDSTAPPAEVALPMLLAKVLLAFALEFERESGHSLAIAANVLRLAGEEGIRVQKLASPIGCIQRSDCHGRERLEERGFAVVQHSEPNRRAKVLILTAKGKHARNVYRSLVRKLEQRWEAKFGSHVINLRHSLEQLVGGSGSLLYGGLEPYPDGWRASLRRPEVLPHYPMVLHRGGFPDGS